ncbi:MAG: 50S ribosomal protein L11 methyltransferase [Mariprofundaceae bacterium]
MQDIISNDSAWLELRLPEKSIGEQDFSRMCEHLNSSGTALQTDAKSGLSEHVAWFPGGQDIQETRARIAAAAMLLGACQTDISLAWLSDDWETAWQRDWHGMPIGDSLWVRPSFCDPAPTNRIDIVLDPGMAFGTGQHATTQLCLRAIERTCMQQAPKNVLDMGAGSGILAIAAAKLGAKGMLAMDNDPACVDACRKNSAINDVRMQCLLDDTPPSKIFDLVVANILAGPLVNMAPMLAGCVGTRLVLSGILSEQTENIIAAYIAAGLKYDRTETMAEWVAIEFTR